MHLHVKNGRISTRETSENSSLQGVGVNSTDGVGQEPALLRWPFYIAGVLSHVDLFCVCHRSIYANKDAHSNMAQAQEEVAGPKEMLSLQELYSHYNFSVNIKLFYNKNLLKWKRNNQLLDLDWSYLLLCPVQSGAQRTSPGGPTALCPGAWLVGAALLPTHVPTSAHCCPSEWRQHSQSPR